MKKILFIFIFNVIFFFTGSNNTILAQGTYTCGFNPQSRCNVSQTNCTVGYLPDYNYCDQFDNNPDDCNNVGLRSCVQDPQAANTCSSINGICKTACAPNEANYGSKSDCSGNTRCCVPPGSGGNCVSLGGTGTGSQSCCPNLFKLCLADQCNIFTCVTSSGPNAPLPTMASGPQFVNCNGGKGILTAIGCIPIAADNQGTGIASFFLRWGLGIAGGIALILIVYSGFMMSTSTGDPRKLQAGKELLTGAVSGLILIVLSAFILDFIGVDILGIL